MSGFEVPDVLASRYASRAMREIWSPEGRVRLERELWIAVLEAQAELGMDVPHEALEAYRAVVDVVDLESIRRRELRLRHDVKARLEEFAELAGYQLVHRGMTSRDLTENVEQLQVRRSLELVGHKSAALLQRLADKASAYRDTKVVARTHNVPAQVTTLGKRFANVAEELILAVERLERLIDNYPLRGIKGPVGTQQDQLDLLGDVSAVERLERAVTSHLGFRRTMTSVGQVYPRSLDFDVVSALVQVAAAPGDLATTIRLMAGHDLISEGFSEDQVGSSAMPHKVNARTCERISALLGVMKGQLAIVAGLVGNQWNEGDVSCSAARRVAIPSAFFAVDAILEAAMTVLDEMVVFEEELHEELRRWSPFLASTRILTRMQELGVGREDAHAILREHSLAAARRMRSEGLSHPPLVDSLASDPRVPVEREEIERLVDPEGLPTGLAGRQVDEVVRRARIVAERWPGARDYRPDPIL